MLLKLAPGASLAGAIAGSTLIAFNLGAMFNVLGYVFFTISSLSSVWLLLRSNAHRALLWTNLYFTVMNVVGMIRYYA